MRVAFLIMVFLHGLIHLLGFIKGFGFREVKELTLPIGRSLGVLWLIAALLILIYGITYVSNSRYVWLAGIIAVVASQILIVLFWRDARFGTLPNAVILIVSIVALGRHNFQKIVQKETSYLLGQTQVSGREIVTANAVERLPAPVKKWLHHSGVIGKRYIHAGKVTQRLELKMKPDQKSWMSASALQYSIIDRPAFIWTVDVRANSFLHFSGRDKFENGHGEMLIRLNSLFSVVHEKGEKLDEGSMQRFLGEMVWFPSLALSPYITWEQISDTVATAVMDFGDVRGSGTFYFDAAGDFIKFSALRFMGNESSAKRHEWVLTVDDYSIFEGIKLPSKMTATWKLDEGEWTWLKLEITDIRYNELAVAKAY